MTAPQQEYVMMMADNEIQALYHMISSKHEPVTVNNGTRTATFKIRKGKLYGYEHTKSGLIKHKVMSESAVKKLMEHPDARKPDHNEIAKREMINKIKHDKPHLTEEIADAQADIIIEAQKTMLELLKTGMEPKLASAMIEHALKLTPEKRDELHKLIVDYENKIEHEGKEEEKTE